MAMSVLSRGRVGLGTAATIPRGRLTYNRSPVRRGPPDPADSPTAGLRNVSAVCNCMRHSRDLLLCGSVGRPATTWFGADLPTPPNPRPQVSKGSLNATTRSPFDDKSPYNRSTPNLSGNFAMERYRIGDDAALYFVTFSVVDWLPIFVSEEPCRIIADSLRFCHEQKCLRV